MPASAEKATVQALSTTALGGYSCVRNGFIFVHPQKVGRTSSSGSVETDAAMMAFYGTAANSLGTDEDNFQCCYRLGYTSSSNVDCKAAINVDTTPGNGVLGDLIEHRVFYKGPNAAADF